MLLNRNDLLLEWQGPIYSQWPRRSKSVSQSSAIATVFEISSASVTRATKPAFFTALSAHLLICFSYPSSPCVNTIPLICLAREVLLTVIFDEGTGDVG